MEIQKIIIINLLNDSNNQTSNFATKKCYIIDSQSNRYQSKETIKSLIFS